MHAARLLVMSDSSRVLFWPHRPLRLFKIVRAARCHFATKAKGLFEIVRGPVVGRRREQVDLFAGLAVGFAVVKSGVLTGLSENRPKTPV